MAGNLVFMVRRIGGNPLAHFAVAYGGTAAIQKGVGFLLFLWLAHSLTVAEYATFGLLFALQTGIAALAGAGVVESVVGLLREHRSTSARRKLFGAANGVFSILSAACIPVVALLNVVFLGDAGVSAYDLLFVTIGGVTTSFFVLQAQLTRLEENHQASLTLSFGPPLAGWIAGFVAFSVQPTVSSFFFGVAIGLFVCLVAFRLGHIGFYTFSIRLRVILPIAARIAPFILIVVLVWLSGYGNTYLVKVFFTATDVARFTFAYTLASIMQLIATSLNQVWSPRFFRIVHDSPLAEVESRNRRFFAVQGLALGLIGGAVLAVVPLAIEKVGPSLADYRDLNLELFLLFSAYALSIPWYHVQNYYFAYSKGRDLLNVTLVTCSVGIAAWIIAMWLFGVIGVYAGFAIMMTTRMLGTVARARWEWPVSMLWEGPALALVLLALGAFASEQLVKMMR